MKILLILFAFIVLTGAGPAFAQGNLDSTIKCKICKPWAVTDVPKRKKVDPDDLEMGNRITFYEDQTVYYTHGSQIREGRWMYDKDSDMIIIMDEDFRNKVMGLKIIKILPRMVIIEMPNEQGKYQEVYLRLID